MTLKDAIKTRKKTSTKKKDDDRFWEVRIDIEAVEQVHMVEYVKASSLTEAQKIATKQFTRCSPELIHDRAMREWRNKNRYSLQHLQITSTEKRKRFTISENQRKILKELIKGKYLKYNHRRWSLTDPSHTPNLRTWHNTEMVSSVSIDALFRKGLLRDLTTANMSDKEVEIQKALGSLPELKAYTIDMTAVKILRLRL